MDRIPDDVLLHTLLPYLERVSAGRLMVISTTMILKAHDPRHRLTWLALLDHKDMIAPMMTRQPGLCFLRLAVPKACLRCMKRTTRKHVFFGIPVCLDCEKSDPELSCVSKKSARRDFRISVRYLEQLEYRETKNPVYPSRAPMRLYLRSDILNQPDGRF